MATLYPLDRYIFLEAGDRESVEDLRGPLELVLLYKIDVTSPFLL
jgi:hypothetical protein